MKYSTLLFVVFLNFAKSIGLQGLIIPQNGAILSTAGAGIAAQIDPSLNSAMHLIDHSYVQSSYNLWLGGITGNNTQLRWGKNLAMHINIQSWNMKGIELWGDIPNNSPLGTFGVHFVSAAYSLSHNFQTPYRFGIRIQSHYSHLFTESLSGISLDFGVSIPINSALKFGAVVRNLESWNLNNNLKS